ncbi:MAG: hypothetical protein ACRCZF_10515, partial [Gemmataceae bacterium]
MTQTLQFSLATTLKQRLRGLQQHLRDWARGETEASYFDVLDVRTINPFLEARGHIPLRREAIDPASGTVAATRWILASLLAEPALRRRFPRALSQGVDGGFAQHLLRTAPSDAARENIRAAFQGEPGLRVRRVFELREDLRAVCPFGLTPIGRGTYLEWLLSF